MQFDLNAFLGKLLDTMPVWLPIVLGALRANIKGVTKQAP